MPIPQGGFFQKGYVFGEDMALPVAVNVAYP
jgi:hypothetical protein